ncbi:unnamed protein product, partial [Rotaria sp. Silwood2]
GEYYVFINIDGTIINLLNILNNQIKNFVYKKQNLSFHEKITCAQIHPNEECLHIIGSHLSIEQTIDGINHLFLPQQASLPSGVMRQESIVINSGKPGYLQFISINYGKLLYYLDIVQENNVSPNDITD